MHVSFTRLCKKKREGGTIANERGYFQGEGHEGRFTFLRRSDVGSSVNVSLKTTISKPKKKQGQQEREPLKWNEKAPYYISNNNHTEMRKKGNI